MAKPVALTPGSRSTWWSNRPGTRLSQACSLNTPVPGFGMQRRAVRSSHQSRNGRALAHGQEPGVERAGADDEAVQLDVVAGHRTVRGHHRAVAARQLGERLEVAVDARISVEEQDGVLALVEEIP